MGLIAGGRGRGRTAIMEVVMHLMLSAVSVECKVQLTVLRELHLVLDNSVHVTIGEGRSNQVHVDVLWYAEAITVVDCRL